MMRSTILLVALAPLALAAGCRQDAAASPSTAGAPAVAPAAAAAPPVVKRPGEVTRPGEVKPQGAVKKPGEKIPDPKQTVGRMLDLALDGDWATYIDRYYGEKHKFRNDADRVKLISRYETKWGDQVVAMLKQVNKLEPRINDDGTRAVFDAGDGKQFTLYRDAAGAWTFRL